MKGQLMLLTILFFMSHTSGKDLGVHGPLFPIQEENLMEIIQRKLNTMEKSGKIIQLNEHLQKKMKERAENPQVVHKLPQAVKSKARLFDPSLSIPDDIKDHKGRIVIKAGTRVNPLDYLNWGEPLILLDGTDAKQVEWAHKTKGKWILTKGSPFKVGKGDNRWVYFDQGGIIVKRFNVKALPARISQKDKHLLIEEIALHDDEGSLTVPKMIFLKDSILSENKRENL